MSDLAWLMIAVSDNTASNILLDLVTPRRIEEVRARLGLKHTTLRHKFMRHANDDPPNETTARELLAVLGAIADHPTGANWMSGLLADQQVRDRLGRSLPTGVSFAGKSGWEPALSHDCGFIRRAGRAGQDEMCAIVAVLTRGIPDAHVAAGFIAAIGSAVAADLHTWPVH